MRKLITYISIFVFFSFSFNVTNVFAESSPKTLTQGIYSVRNNNLLVDTPLNVTITPSNAKAIIIVVDSDQTVEALVRLNPKITKQTLPPLNYDSSIIIFGTGSVIFS